MQHPSTHSLRSSDLQHHLLIIGAQNIGALRHEMHATKNDVFGLFSVGGPLRQFEGVPPDISELDHLISLVMMADRKSTRLNSSNVSISYAVLCLNKK